MAASKRVGPGREHLSLFARLRSRWEAPQRAVLRHLAAIEQPTDEALEAAIRRRVHHGSRDEGRNEHCATVRRSLSCGQPVPGQKGPFQMRSSMVCLFLFVASSCAAPAGSGSLTALSADPGDDRVILVGESTTLSGLRSCDSEETATGGLAYAWTMLEKPDNSTVEPSSDALQSVQFGITPDIAGTYLFRLVVTNGSRTSQPEIVVVEATTNEARVTAPSSTPETEDRCGNTL